MGKLSFPAGPESLRRLLVGLRSLQERLPDPTALAPARAMAGLDPVTAWFPVAGNWRGAMAEAKASGVLWSFGEAPVNVPSARHGQNRGQAEDRPRSRLDGNPGRPPVGVAVRRGGNEGGMKRGIEGVRRYLRGRHGRRRREDRALARFAS